MNSYAPVRKILAAAITAAIAAPALAAWLAGADSFDWRSFTAVVSAAVVPVVVGYLVPDKQR